jgi:hypothetical protein
MMDELRADQIHQYAAQVIKKKNKEKHEARSWLGEGEDEYTKQLCAVLMRRVIDEVEKGASSGFITHYIESNTDSEEVPAFPFWLVNRAMFIKQYFEGLGYHVKTEKNAKGHGFGDWNRWYGVDIWISW